MFLGLAWLSQAWQKRREQWSCIVCVAGEAIRSYITSCHSIGAHWGGGSIARGAARQAEEAADLLRLQR